MVFSTFATAKAAFVSRQIAFESFIFEMRRWWWRVEVELDSEVWREVRQGSYRMGSWSSVPNCLDASRWTLELSQANGTLLS